MKTKSIETMNKLTSWVQLLSQIRVTGAVAFSSDTLAKKMLNRVDFSNADIIIELGGGCGCITKEIVKSKKPETKLLVFEINESFCKVLKEKFDDENIYIINDSAENLEKHLFDITGKRTVDCVISSLPFTIINEKIRENIIMMIHNILTPYSLFVQFGYNKKKYREMLNEFETVNTSFVLGNLPPAYVFNCKVND